MFGKGHRYHSSRFAPRDAKLVRYRCMARTVTSGSSICSAAVEVDTSQTSRRPRRPYRLEWLKSSATRTSAIQYSSQRRPACNEKRGFTLEILYAPGGSRIPWESHILPVVPQTVDGRDGRQLRPLSHATDATRTHESARARDIGGFKTTRAIISEWRCPTATFPP